MKLEGFAYWRSKTPKGFTGELTWDGMPAARISLEHGSNHISCEVAPAMRPVLVRTMEEIHRHLPVPYLEQGNITDYVLALAALLEELQRFDDAFAQLDRSCPPEEGSYISIVSFGKNWRLQPTILDADNGWGMKGVAFGSDLTPEEAWEAALFVHRLNPPAGHEKIHAVMVIDRRRGLPGHLSVYDLYRMCKRGEQVNQPDNDCPERVYPVKLCGFGLARYQRTSSLFKAVLTVRDKPVVACIGFPDRKENLVITLTQWWEIDTLMEAMEQIHTAFPIPQFNPVKASRNAHFMAEMLWELNLMEEQYQKAGWYEDGEPYFGLILTGTVWTMTRPPSGKTLPGCVWIEYIDADNREKAMSQLVYAAGREKSPVLALPCLIRRRAFRGSLTPYSMPLSLPVRKSRTRRDGMAKEYLPACSLDEFTAWLRENGWTLQQPHNAEVLRAVRGDASPLVLYAGKTPGMLSVPQRAAACVFFFRRQQRIRKKSGMAPPDIVEGLERLERELIQQDSESLSHLIPVVRAAITALR